MSHKNTKKDERRRDRRVAVDLWVEEHTDDALYFQRATNLSLSGLFLERTLPHPPGTRVDIQLSLPGDNNPLRVAGEVVPGGSRELGMAVRFVGIEMQQRARIAEFLGRG